VITRIDELEEFLRKVAALVSGRLRRLAAEARLGDEAHVSAQGKMVRTKFAARLAQAGIRGLHEESLQRLCATVEMAHTASLFHDDVIDNAMVRRGWPSLWRSAGASGAILLGDLLLCETLQLLLGVDEGRYVQSFVAKITEICRAEAEQEIALRGRPLDVAACLRLARSKTGPLFSFLGRVCGGEDARLADALEEVGYQVGTAFQLADDLVDKVGGEETAGKTLGTDAERGKHTLAEESAAEEIRRCCECAIEKLAEWPRVREGLSSFLACDLEPLFERSAGISVGFTK